MSYLIDIENPAIEWAMENLGIKEEEVLQKKLSDFAEDEVPREVQVIRFGFYKRNIEKTRKLIYEMAKLYDTEGFPIVRTPKTNISAMGESSRQKSYINVKDKELIYHAIEAANFEVKSLTPVAKGYSDRRKTRFADIKQKDTFRRITTEQNLAYSKALSNIATPKNEIQRHESSDYIRIHKCTPYHESLEDREDTLSNISDKLLNFQEKFEKSAAIHQDYINKKRESAKSANSVERLKKETKSLERQHGKMLEKIIKKQEIVEKRKLKSFQQSKERWDNFRKEKEQKIIKIEEHNHEKLKQLEAKAEALKQKSQNSESFYVTQKKIFVKGLGIKAEVKKLKDEQASTTGERIRKLK